MTCKECGGDVTRIFVGPTVKYVHAVKGIDHGPLPIEAPTSRNGAQGATPVREPHPRSPEPSLLARAPGTGGAVRTAATD